MKTIDDRQMKAIDDRQMKAIDDRQMKTKQRGVLNRMLVITENNISNRI